MGLVRVLVLAAVTGCSVSHGATIDFTPVGRPGNPADPATGFGAVAYGYLLGTYEVTNEQYAEFLNSVARTDSYGLYNEFMGSNARGGINRQGQAGSYTYSVKENMGNKPVNWVSWYDAARFANWLQNGQPTGLQTTATTEGGAYTLNGNSGMPERNPSATIWIPTQDEWYKAAYYDPTAGGGADDYYWQFPTRSNVNPIRAIADSQGNVINPGANVANHLSGASWNGQVGNVTSVGGTGSSSYFGTFDQGGNVFEWSDTPGGLGKIIRGGSWRNFFELDVSAYRLSTAWPYYETGTLGFRVAAIPEPRVEWLAWVGMSVGFLSKRRRSARGNGG